MKQLSEQLKGIKKRSEEQAIKRMRTAIHKKFNVKLKRGELYVVDVSGSTSDDYKVLEAYFFCAYNLTEYKLEFAQEKTKYASGTPTFSGCDSFDVDRIKSINHVEGY